MIRRTFSALIVASLLASGAPAIAQGFPGDRWAPRDDRGRAGQDVPLGQILQNLRNQYGGQHLDARRQGDVYQIIWLAQDGRRMVIEVDAHSGRTISVRG